MSRKVEKKLNQCSNNASTLQISKIKLHRETLRSLTAADLTRVGGGLPNDGHTELGVNKGQCDGI